MFNSFVMDLHRTTFLLLALIFASSAFAQSDLVHNSCKELNTLYAGSYRFHVNNEQQLEVEFYNSSGNFRQDMVYLDFLDPEMVTYNSEENAVSIRCAESDNKCIDKEIYKLDVVKHSSRINLQQENIETANRTIELIKEVILAHRVEQEEVEKKNTKMRKGKNETRKKR